MEIISFIADVLNTANESFWVLYLANQLLPRRKEDEKGGMRLAVALVGYVVLIIGANQIVLVSPYTMLVAILYAIIVVSIIWKSNILIVLAIVNAYYAVFFIISLLEISVIGWLGGEKLLLYVTREQGTYRLFFIVICGFIWIMLNWLSNRIIPWRILREEKNYIIGISFLGVVASLYITQQFLINFSYHVNILTYIFTILFLIACYGGYIFFKYKELLQKQQMDFERECLMEDKYQQLNEYYRTNKKLYHDMNAHFRAVREMAKDGKTEEIIQYIEETQNLLPYKGMKVLTGLDIVDSILTEKVIIAEEMGIEIKLDIGMIPIDNHIKNWEWCSVFSNLLNNCMEAKPTKIRMEVHVSGEIVIIQVQNDYAIAPVLTERGYQTAKKNKREHGLGLRIIEEIAERYQGNVIYKDDEGMFAVTVVMNFREY